MWTFLPLIFAAAFAVTSGTLPLHAQSPGPSTVMLDPAVLTQIRESVRANAKEYKEASRKLTRDADKASVLGPWSVMEKSQIPPSGDRHDYMSLGRYFWPDPSKPGGLPYIQRDGETNPEVDSITDNKYFGQMCKATGTLSLAWFFTGEERYAGRAALLLRTWFLDPEKRMNPNLNFGQMVKGKGEKGRPSGLIEMRGLVDVMDAAALLEGSESWTAEDVKGLKQWFREYYTWLMTDEIGRKEYATTNNHGVWVNVQAGAIAFFIGQRDSAEQQIEAAKLSRIAVQITPEGQQPRELQRTRSLHYTLFNLDAFFSLAMVGSRVGVDLWHYETADGRSIRKALDWVLPFVTGEKEWTYQQIDEEALDKFYPVLLQAWSVYGDEKYREAAIKVGGDNAGKDRSNLLIKAR
jgi:hypothetical protein